MSVRAVLLKLHLWVALAAGVFLIILGGTGAMLVFAPAYDRAMDRELLVVKPGPTRLSLQAIFERASVAGTPAIVQAPRDDDESVLVFVINAKKKPASVWVNPYTGEVLGTRTIADQQKGLMLRARGLHRNLLQGKNGGKVVGVVTILAVFMALTGLILWWPRKIFSLNTDASASRINFDLHNTIGIFSSAMLLVLSLTGVAIYYPKVGGLISRIDTVTLTEPEIDAPAGVAPLTIDSLVAIGGRAMPGTKPAAISPAKPGSAVMTMGRWYPDEPRTGIRSRLWLNAYTGDILRVDDSKKPTPGTRGSWFRFSMLLLHTGALFGWVSLTLVFLGSVSQVAMVITGLLIWWKRTFRTGKRRAAAAGALLALTLVPGQMEAQYPTDNAIRAVIKRRVDSGGVKGLVVGTIGRDGRKRVVTYGTSGTPGVALDENTVFEIGSLTKTFTATILADMVLRGEVSLDDLASKYLPVSVKMPSRNGRQITLLDLVTHTSGLPKIPNNLVQTDPKNPYASYTVQNMYDYLSSVTLTRDPGVRFEYSNTGVGLLGHILSLRVNKNYEDLLIERVLNPLGMSNTRITLTPTMRAHLAQGHDKAGAPKQPWDLPTIAGAGAVRTNMHDLLIYLAAQRDTTRGPLAKAIAMTHRNFHAGPNMQVSVGLAWHRLSLKTGTVVYHSGETGGYHSYMGFDPATGANAVLLANTTGPIDEIGLQFIDATQRLKEDLVEPTIPRSVLESYVGKYQTPAGPIFQISFVGNRLAIAAPGRQPIPLYAENETTFYIKGPNAGLVFHRSLNGSVVALDLRTGDEYEWSPRVP